MLGNHWIPKPAVYKCKNQIRRFPNLVKVQICDNETNMIFSEGEGRMPVGHIAFCIFIEAGIVFDLDFIHAILCG